jgi:hypothetical protein
MLKSAIVVASSLFGSSNADTLHYVQEVVRHGARAPTLEASGFSVAPGELTSSGMRQRYLLGHFNRERYIETYGLINSREELYIQTTNYDRTF